jgi:antitoxin (DNA-binding transcriptional repressor) of toxin-antitoxin stability system
MTFVTAQELSTDTAGVIRRMQAGEDIVPVRGKPWGGSCPCQSRSRFPIRHEEFVRRMQVARADPGLRDDLARLAGETTDDYPNA